ncbi:alpha/beta fold hydrolase [Rhodobacterales bacterium HKCCE3408]|nr:alpha/beta fold hydrolase [Rhodobacterales bacterium HKCCE3408]
MTADYDWTDAYENAAYIPGGGTYPARWTEAAAAFRTAARAEIDLPYGPAPRNRFDLFHPEGTPEGLVVFIHGGYWLRFDKSYWSHLAAGPVSAGWAVAMPSYTLAPDARISEMTREIATMVTRAAGMIDGPIHLTGHSAGGHLAARMGCTGVLPDAVADRIARIIPISGVNDLRLIRYTEMNETLGIDAAEAEAESPVLLEPRRGPRITAWVGAEERPEFLRMTRALVESWGRKGAVIDGVYERGRHHFDVIDGLEQPYSILCQSLLS